MNTSLGKQIFILGFLLQTIFARNSIEQRIQSAEIVINAFSGVESRVEFEHRHLTPHLHEITLHGHTLPDDIKVQLQAVGFDFTSEFVSRKTADNERAEGIGLDQYYDVGIFRFHYTLNGTHSVDVSDSDGNNIPDYIDQVAATFTHVYHQEINQMGYFRPPSDGWLPSNYDNGGSAAYDIYIRSISANYYGYVMSEYNAQNTGNNEFSPGVTEINAFTSYMAMRNNYSGFYSSNNDYGPTTELEAMQVTAAHEFFHAVQYGYDGREKPWLLEATATWIEEIVYDDINDCYQYMPSWFDSPHTSLDKSGGTHWYGSYIYFKYIEEHLGGCTTIRNIFERGIEINSEHGDYSHQAISAGLEPVGSSFQDALNKMVIANRIMSSDPGPGAEIYFYEEAEVYPVDGPETYGTMNFSEGDTESITSTNLKKYASQYLTLNTDTPALVSLTNMSGPENDLELHAIIKTETGRHLVRSGSQINIDPSIGVEWISLAVVSQNAEGADWNFEVVIKDGKAENYSPLAFSIIAPTDSSIIDTSFITFSWHKAIDSDEDDIVSYDVELGANIENLTTIYSGQDTTCSVNNLSDNPIYHWRVIARDLENNVVYNDGGTFIFMIQMDDISEKVVLSHPYPNPFPVSGSPVNNTRIKIILKESQIISIKIMNILGQEVTKLFSGELSAGFYDHFAWDGKMGNGKKAPSGIYFILVEGDQLHTRQKVTLLR